MTAHMNLKADRKLCMFEWVLQGLGWGASLKSECIRSTPKLFVNILFDVFFYLQRMNLSCPFLLYWSYKFGAGKGMKISLNHFALNVIFHLGFILCFVFQDLAYSWLSFSRVYKTSFLGSLTDLNGVGFGHPAVPLPDFQMIGPFPAPV